MSATYEELASITDIDRHRWCRYLKGQVPPTYLTIKKASEKLDMKASTLVDCIEKRIKNGKKKKVALKHNAA